jgi:hypothetical protein
MFDDREGAREIEGTVFTSKEMGRPACLRTDAGPERFDRPHASIHRYRRAGLRSGRLSPTIAAAGSVADGAAKWREKATGWSSDEL